MMTAVGSWKGGAGADESFEASDNDIHVGAY